jgi:outer membrane receptor protein involved in Fe transport
VFNTSGNFPGASSGERDDARDLYAVLVGSVDTVDGDARIDAATNQYAYLGQSLQEGRLRDFAFWAQDAWRPRPDLTINVGLRYELQMPFQALNDSYSGTTLEEVWGISGLAAGCDASNVTPETCNIFKPGLTPGNLESNYFQLNRSENLFEMDWDNFAPSLGLAWTPSAESGAMASFLASRATRSSAPGGRAPSSGTA